jgi:hypothetical protein
MVDNRCALQFRNWSQIYNRLVTSHASRGNMCTLHTLSCQFSPGCQNLKKEGLSRDHLMDLVFDSISNHIRAQNVFFLLVNK